MKREESLDGPLHSTEYKSSLFLNIFPRALTCGRRLVSILAAAATIGILGTLWSLPASAIEYIYDELGRVVGVVSPSGESARHNYDSLGNIIAIDRFGLAAISILEFTPNRGPVGTLVVINGTGFSATIAQNTVKFNGVAATIASATATKLVVTVPATATMGEVTVTSPAGTATSAADFVIAAATAGVPTITSFTPTSGIAGTVVAVTGSNFDPASGATAVRFNESHAYVTAVTATTLNATVPANTGSGRIRVVTANGSGSSAADFLIPPSGILAANVGTKQRISVGGPAQTLTIATANKVGAFLFDGTAGSYLTFNVAALSTSPAASVVAYQIYDPRNVLVVSSFTSASASIHIPPLTTSGTYTIYFQPTTSTATITAALVADKAIVLNGPGLAETVTFTNQTARLNFTGTAGQNLGVGFTGLTFTPSTATYATVMVYTPSGAFIDSTYCYTSSSGGSGCAINLINLPASGTYSVIVTPVGGATGSFTAILSSDLAVTLTAGTAYSLNLTRAGQNGRLSFAGTSGQNLGLTLSAVTITGAAGGGSVTINKPDGTALAGASFSSGTTTVFDLPTLPTTGTYTLFFDPPAAATASMAVLLAQALQAPLVLNAAPLPVTLLTGQNGRFSFTLASTQSLGLGVTAVNTTPAGGSVDVQVQQPNGSFISCGGFTASGSCNLPGLVAGTYTVFVEPGVNAANLTLTLSSDLTGTLIANGPAQIFSTLRVGQNGAYTLTATAGQKLALSWPGSTIGTGGLSVIAPGSTPLFSSVSLASSNVLEWTAVAGTYQVLIDPTGASTGNVALQLATDLTGTLTINGATTTVSLLPGQNGRFTFAGVAGQNLGLGISAYATTPPGGSADLSILGPTGAVFASTTLSGLGTSLNASALPASGTYTVVVDPVGVPSANFNVTLSQDSVGTLTANGPAATFASARIGQNGAYTFSGSAGQGMAMLLSNSTLGVSSLAVRGPSGVVSSTNLAQPGNFVLDLGALPVAGTYTAFIDPAGIQTGAVTMALVSDLTGALTVNSAAATPISMAAAQNARYTFTGSAGARYAVAITGISTLPAGVGVSVSVRDPSGNNVTNCGTLSTDTICDVPALNTTGTYTVFIDPPGAATASLAFTVKSEVTGTVTVDSASATATTFTAGQNVRLSFNNATAGATPKLTVSGLTLAPVGSQAYLRVLDPSGNNIFGNTYWVFTTSGYTVTLPALGSVGNYTIEFDPRDFATGLASFAVKTSTATSINIDGATVTVPLVANQQPALNFATTVANQAITLSFSAMSTTPAGGALRYSMSNATSWTSNIVAPGVNIPQLPLANVGNYSMTLLPQSAFSGAVTVALVNDQTGTLTIGGAAVTHTPARIAQSKRITFTNSTANRATTIRINSSQWTSGTWWLIPPPGGGVITSTFPASTVARNISLTLVPTGTYTLILVPAGTNTGTVSASVL